ncbi:U3 small nucleolar ribonucleoprotein protein IMP3 isoform X2 [Neodiprion virginianus]|uniref:U3 small nucleolar ribonucleoprotein protein IMP3 isoform X2 n=1 Tax=Neodiprion virginianus TaxID=2961670 RepID=UPI001EE696FB|nr:U3 small nucleolar ribonucleoprotein protein IMP3 isoform X2 [Neodiprion virginianus]
MYIYICAEAVSAQVERTHCFPLKTRLACRQIHVFVYNKLSRQIRELARKIKEVDAEHPFRIEQSAMLLEKLYMMGLISTKWDLSLCEKVTASCFCRRRLPVVMVRNKMSETIKMATKLIEQAHVRVGPEVIKDPAFLVTRNLEDFVTWVDTSAIRKHVLEYNEMKDDFEGI